MASEPKKRTRFLPRGGTGFWWLPIGLGGAILAPGAFSSAAVFPFWVGVIGLVLFFYGLNRLTDFKDLTRD